MPTVEIQGVGRVQFPDDMSPEQITQAIETDILKKSEPEKPADPLRQTALVGRAAAEGVVDTLALPIDMQERLVAPLRNAIAKQLGIQLPDDFTVSGLLRKGLDAAGAYNPETEGEQMTSAVTRGVTGALTGGGLGGISGGAQIARTALSGATAAGGSEYARQQGAGPGVQMLAGLAGGLAPAAVEGTARLASQTLRGAARPLTRGGQETIAAQIMQQNADDPAVAAANLNAANDIVPGSARTAGEASKDVGLLTIEKGLRSQNPEEFGRRISEQNSARQAELARLGGSPQDIAAAKSSRDAITAPMREGALSGTQSTPIQRVHTRIDTILASPSGKRETISKAMQWAKEQIGDETDPASLYEIRKDLQLAQRGKLQPSNQNAPNASTLAQARSQLGDVISELDDAIETAAPGFKAYLERYRELSKPIDQMKVIQEIRRRAEITAADIKTGSQFIGNAPFSRALDSALQKGGDKLTRDQVQRLEAIRTDLHYAQAVNSPLVKAPGSDTFQNLSIAQVLGAGPSAAHPALRILAKPLSWLYKIAGTDTRVNEMLTDAMLDPKLSAKLLQRATPKSMNQFAAELRRSAYASGLGATGSVAASMSEERADRARRQESQAATKGN
jgi:hypothetical protein